MKILTRVMPRIKKMLKYYEPDKEVKMGGTLYPSKDLGTPISSTELNASEKIVTLCIDGRTLSVPAGTSIMRAAAINDINIPKLCACLLYTSPSPRD